jgi:hypothetical protein
MYYFADAGNERAKEIFDACKTIIPPMVTLIFGYYFGRGRTDGGKEHDEPADRRTAPCAPGE